MINIIKDNKSKLTYIIFFILILVISAFMRFYRINEFMTYLGDEGRDMLVVKRMIVDHKLTLLGPITSVGSMYMGPIYYYIMTPFLWIWQLNPVGPAVMVAIFGICTVALIFITGNIFIHPIVGLVASLLYAVSPLPVVYGRSSWNPNIVPFFSLLVIFALLNVVIKKKYIWLAIAGLSLGILIQLHYVTFMFFPIIFTILALIKFRIPVKYYLLAFLMFLLAYSPFLLFELRHGFVNTQSAIRFVLFQKRAGSAPFLLSFWKTISDVSVRLFWRLVVVVNAEIAKIYILIQLVSLGFFAKKFSKQKDYTLALKVILIWLVVGILSYGLYGGVIYDYYFGSLFTVPYLLFGIMFYYFWCQSKLGKMIAIIILIVLIIFNLYKSPVAREPNNMLKNSETIAAFVREKAGNKPYNFALIAGQNSDHAYRYFLEIWGNPPKVIENPAKDPNRLTVTDTLLVVCEEKICQPLGHPLWEIAGFGRADIIGEWTVSTAKVFELKHIKDYPK